MSAMPTTHLPPPSDDDPATQVFDADPDPDPDAAAVPAPDAVPAPAVPDGGEGGKLKMIVALLKRSLGVKDLAAMRLSLPASLLEPMPNLEYWQYLDRPDLFAAINDSEDPFQRMLAVLRFTFSKELKFIRGKICKPYNSVLGEHFRAHWDVIPVSYAADPCDAPTQHLYVASPTPSSHTDVASVASAHSSRVSVAADAASIMSTSTGSARRNGVAPHPAGASTLSLVPSATDVGAMLEAGAADARRVRVVFLTEQVSHHPPISSYYMACPARGVCASGVDQIAARVSGTAIRVAPGAANKGIFVALAGGPGAGERYQITHPTAQVNGILRGSFYATVADSTIVTATGGADADAHYRAVVEYKEESWLGKPQFALEGVVHRYAAGETAHEAWTRAKHVPKARVVAQLEGSWRHRIRWRRPGDTEWRTLLDLSTLHVVPKAVRPLGAQLANESRKLWEHVTAHLLRREFGEATRAKLAIEQRQRDLAAERARAGVGFEPVFFEKDIASGESRLTPAGDAAVRAEMDEPDEPGGGDVERDAVDAAGAQGGDVERDAADAAGAQGL